MIIYVNYGKIINWRFQKKIAVPGTTSKVFQNNRIKLPTDILLGTGDKNDRIEYSNNNENMDNV